jgi:hypothetical protein
LSFSIGPKIIPLAHHVYSMATTNCSFQDTKKGLNKAFHVLSSFSGFLALLPKFFRWLTTKFFHWLTNFSDGILPITKELIKQI